MFTLFSSARFNWRTTLMGLLHGFVTSALTAKVTEGMGWKQAVAASGAGVVAAMLGIAAKDGANTGLAPK